MTCQHRRLDPLPYSKTHWRCECGALLERLSAAEYDRLRQMAKAADEFKNTQPPRLPANWRKG